MTVVLTTLLVGSLAGCVGSRREAREAEERRVDAIELQERLERFTGVFLDRFAQAAMPLTSAPSPPDLRAEALRQVLHAGTAVLDIATGPRPETNLLDMLVFIDLTTRNFEEHWVPHVFGEAGEPLLAVLRRSTGELDQLAGIVLSPTQVADVHELARAWREENPEQHLVQGARLFTFAGASGQAERERQVRGLLASVKAATRTADEARLLGERVLFLAQRVPFLLRFQLRIGALELLGDGLAGLSQADLGPALDDASALATKTGQALDDARVLVETLHPLLEPPVEGQEPLRVEQLVDTTTQLVDDSRVLMSEVESVDRLLTSATRATERATTLVRELRDLLPADEEAATRRLDALARRLTAYAAILGALLLSLFWGGYVLASRAARGPRAGPTAAAPRELVGARRGAP